MPSTVSGTLSGPATITFTWAVTLPTWVLAGQLSPFSWVTLHKRGRRRVAHEAGGQVDGQILHLVGCVAEADVDVDVAVRARGEVRRLGR